MKKPLLLSFVLLAIYVHSQTINWAINTPEPPFKTRLTTDRTSNVYIYGYSETIGADVRQGTIIRKYSADAQLLLNLHWKEKIFITAMVNDGIGNFYFCGYFRGNINENGFSLKSQGEADGFLGKMNEDGKLAWAIGFGGIKRDMASDIVLNPNSSEIVITGCVDSTVYIDGYPMTTTSQAIFIAKFDLKGKLLSHRIYDFCPKEYGENAGIEIRNNGADGYYLHASRMGDHWSHEESPSGSPMEGRYIFSLDRNFKILWSQFIISSACYYGYSCGNMSVYSGQVCVPSYCSGKYGGDGRLRKLDATTGTNASNILNPDGQYYDTYGAGNYLFYVGNEEANGCPCESYTPGFARVKMLDKNNVDQVLLSKSDFHFRNITQAPNGNIYVAGAVWGDEPQLQGTYLLNGYILFSMQNPVTSRKFSGESKPELQIFPNPSSGNVEVLSESNIEEIIVLDSRGAIIRKLNPESRAATITDLTPGYYIIRIKDPAGLSSRKVLVTK